MTLKYNLHNNLECCVYIYIYTIHIYTFHYTYIFNLENRVTLLPPQC